MNLDNKIYLEGIETTGFELEFNVSNILQKNGWTVINNKYYIDDVEGGAREIDIVAYKVSPMNGILIYTALFISCKKSHENIWALLVKDRDEKDPNINWNPITTWSNDIVLKFVIEKENWLQDYINKSSSLKDQVFTPSRHIFAFQELNKKNGKAQNDKPIFNSVVSLMKAQDYEISTLDVRRKERSIYFFNLLSIIDSDLIRIYFKDGEKSIENVESDIYICRYIINKKETTSRVHFINYTKFDQLLKYYNELHKHNIEQTGMLFNLFYTHCLKDTQKSNLFLDQFNSKLQYILFDRLTALNVENAEHVKITEITWNKLNDSPNLHLGISLKDSEYLKLKNNSEIKVEVKKALKDIYHYEGDFFFAQEQLPF